VGTYVAVREEHLKQNRNICNKICTFATSRVV